MLASQSRQCSPVPNPSALDSIKCLSIILCLAALGLTACSANKTAESVSAKPVVTTYIVQSETIQPSLETFGTVVYRSKVDVHSTTDGIIDQIYDEEGDFVYQGKILTVLEHKKLLIQRDQAEAAVGSKEASYRLAEAQYMDGVKNIQARFISIANAESAVVQAQAESDNIEHSLSNKLALFDAGGVSKTDLESIKTQAASAKNQLIQAQGQLEIQRLGYRDEDIRAAGQEVPADPDQRQKVLTDINTRVLKAELDVAKADLDAAQAAIKSIDLLIDEASIQAPISGVIGARYFDAGGTVTVDKPIFTIFDTTRVYVDCDLSEKDAAQVTEGLAATIKTDTGQTFRAVLKKIFPFINTDSRTIRARLDLANPGSLLKPGMFMHVSIPIGQSVSGLSIPLTAIRDADGKNPVTFVIRQ